MESKDIESKSISIRLPVETVGILDDLAKKQHLLRGTMVRRWVLERLEKEGCEYEGVE